ncbi:dihydrolipoyl dehydrogenase [Thiomicrorhabdus sp. ZW0627]|uniref:dihydrolipoyl dehydrogenase n=1 Tax=Thiomicrorhabdus sp. ZW0627 TaxID=3039774 RepID=UPI002436662F|nr:dihydrolipoyl dehydrogenase [Thiomicrorhabdus sp. ZW0627]MDG6773396.1 dihydrolipoyl dehydrogenase [Thiomicrorhabdus sp. ZW0627]
MRKVEYAILGAGSAGLTALGVIRKRTDDFVIINGGHYGTTCARVGCMPSKTLIQSANLFHKRSEYDEFGLEGAEAVSVDVTKVMERVRRYRDLFTAGVQSGTTDTLKPGQSISGFAKFVAPNRIEVNGEIIEAERIIIATGSRPVVPTPWKALGDLLHTSDTIFEQVDLPKSIAVIGLGAIGLEMGQAISRLGTEVYGFEMLERIGGLFVSEVNQEAQSLISNEFPMYLGEAAQLERRGNRVLVKTSKVEVEVDAVLASLGRRPNIDMLGLEKAGVPLDEKGMPVFDLNTMQIGDQAVFMAGDVNAYRPILHEAGYEGKMAALNAVNYPEVTAFRRKAPIGIAFTEPNIGVFGTCYHELDPEKLVMSTFYLKNNNVRAMVMAEDKGVICLYADKQSKKLVGGEMVMPHAEHFVHLLAWAVENEMTVAELMTMPFYHPVLEEVIQSAIEKLYYAAYEDEERASSPELTVMQ